jgi:excisionase family DNA binding protein
MKRRTIDGQLLGVSEASRMIGNSERSLRALVAKGAVPFRRLGSRVVFRKTELEKFLDGLPGVTLRDAEANRKLRSKQ